MSNKSVSIDVDIIQGEPSEKPQQKSQEKLPHNGKTISKLEISMNGKYLVTYSEEDEIIVGWNVEGIEEGKNESVQTLEECIYEPDNVVKLFGDIIHMRISDKKILTYI